MVKTLFMAVLALLLVGGPVQEVAWCGGSVEGEHGANFGLCPGDAGVPYPPVQAPGGNDA